jgi:steroid delta-isomerase-like uncharacterized protein
MSTVQNKEVFRQFVEEILNQGNMDRFDDLMATDFIEHEELPPGIPEGSEGAKVLFNQLHRAFPDFKADINDLIAEGDRVVVRMTWTGTHEGEFMGIPATGNSISIEVIDIVRIANGKFVEHWGIIDNMGMMQQLGVVPEPGQVAA